MEDGSWILPTLGGALIGLASLAMMALHGRIAGISGIFGGYLAGDRAPWRVLFVTGLVVGGLVMALLTPGQFAVPPGRSSAAIIVAGLMVGLGTRMGNGCTSGHGVCGIGRLSRRSIVATVTFISSGAAMVMLTRLGGA